MAGSTGSTEGVHWVSQGSTGISGLPHTNIKDYHWLPQQVHWVPITQFTLSDEIPGVANKLVISQLPKILFRTDAQLEADAKEVISQLPKILFRTDAQLEADAKEVISQLPKILFRTDAQLEADAKEVISQLPKILFRTDAQLEADTKELEADAKEVISQLPKILFRTDAQLEADAKELEADAKELEADAKEVISQLPKILFRTDAQLEADAKEVKQLLQSQAIAPKSSNCSKVRKMVKRLLRSAQDADAIIEASPDLTDPLVLERALVSLSSTFKGKDPVQVLQSDPDALNHMGGESRVEDSAEYGESRVVLAFGEEMSDKRI
eukprot:gene23377-30638_t